MEADLHVSLQSTKIKGWGLSRLNDERSPAYVTREKSVFSLEDPVMMF